MKDIIWEPSKQIIKKANITRFMKKHHIKDYDELIQRSTHELEWFWDAVIKDLVDIAEGRPLPMPSSAEPLNLGSTQMAERRYYLRFSVANQAGVLARICDIFWKHNISIAGVIQKEPVSSKFVPVVMTTYTAKEKDMQDAIKAVDKLAVAKAPTRLIRILSANT